MWLEAISDSLENLLIPFVEKEKGTTKINQFLKTTAPQFIKSANVSNALLTLELFVC